MLELVVAGWWSGIPGAGWPPPVWFALPAAVVTAIAGWAMTTRRPRALVVILAASAFVNLWLPLALAPLLFATRVWPPTNQWRAAAVAAALLAAAAHLVTPSCGPVTDTLAFAVAPPGQMPGMVFAALGLAGVALVAVDAGFSQHSRREQGACVAALVTAAALAATVSHVDRTALLGTMVALLWTRVLAGARHILQWQTSAIGRLGAAVLLMLVPLLSVAKAARPGFHDTDPAAGQVWHALEAVGSSAGVVAGGGRADVATAVWRAGPSSSHHSLELLPLVPEVLAAEFATRPIHAWPRTAEALAMRGFLVAAGIATTDHPTPLARVIDYTACQTLAAAWIDALAATAAGQVAVVFPEIAPLRGGLMYLASTERLAPQPLKWPPDTLQGFEATAFDRQVSADAGALAAATARDGLDLGGLGDARFVVRARFDRRGSAPATLRVSLGGVATAAWARLYARADAPPGRQPSLCLSSAGLVITAYEGAPPRVTLDLASPEAVGSGWHAFERAGDEGFRWTSGSHADLLFAAHRPQPLVLHVDAHPGVGDWAAAGMRVTLNGADARCAGSSMPCDWHLPMAAMRRGVNVVTLHATPVQAPAPDPRQLGLRVHAVSLSTTPPAP